MTAMRIGGIRVKASESAFSRRASWYPLAFVATISASSSIVMLAMFGDLRFARVRCLKRSVGGF